MSIAAYVTLHFNYGGSIQIFLDIHKHANVWFCNIVLHYSVKMILWSVRQRCQTGSSFWLELRWSPCDSSFIFMGWHQYSTSVYLTVKLCLIALHRLTWLCLILFMQGEVEFRSILYVPATKKEDITDRKTKNIRLYVKRVFISDDFDGELVCLIHSSSSWFFVKF